jgi:cobalt-zinc-cadmium efflux system outer membrane protein
MRSTIRGGAAVAVCALLASRPASAETLTLAEALARAEQHPEVALAREDRALAAGERRQAGLVRHNPELTLAAGPSWAPGVTRYDLEGRLAQTIELGGKRARRLAVARAGVESADAALARSAAVARATIRERFGRALVAGARLGVAREDAEVARATLDAARERLALGAATQTEVNVAVAAAGRATGAVRAAERDVLQTRAALAAAVGAAPTAELEPTGPLPRPTPLAAADDALVARALAARPELTLRAAAKRRASAELDAAGAEAAPDLTVAVAAAHSATEEIDAVLLELMLPLPLWNRGQGSRDAARAAVRRADTEEAVARREVERDVRLAARRYRLAAAAVAELDRDVGGALHENLELARAAMASGKIGLLELSAIRRDLVESQRAYLDAVDELVAAARDLEVALGGAVEDAP